MIPRKIQTNLSQHIKNKSEFNNVLLIEGARQVGKTTLIRETLKGLGQAFKEINLEEQKVLVEKIDLCPDFERFTELVQLETRFRRGGEEILFIDEAQESRKLGHFVRFMKEKWPYTQVILSGSSLSRLFRDEVRYPVGRVTSLLLQPCSFEEFLAASGEDLLIEQVRSFVTSSQISSLVHLKLLEFLQKYMEVGGLPEVVTSYFANRNWQEIRKNILLGYYNDFKRIFGEEKQIYFIAALQATAFLLGSSFKNSYVAGLLDGGKNRLIVEALGQLESWKILIRVDQRGPIPETQFHPKRYLFDTGLAKSLREAALPSIHLISTMESSQRSPLGGLIENVMANVLVPYTTGLSGWRKSSSGSEIDFIFKREEKPLPIECKATTTVKKNHLKGILDFMNAYDLSLGIFVSLSPLQIIKFPAGKTIFCLPLYLAERLEEVARYGSSVSPIKN